MLDNALSIKAAVFTARIRVFLRVNAFSVPQHVYRLSSNMPSICLHGKHLICQQCALFSPTNISLQRGFTSHEPNIVQKGGGRQGLLPRRVP